jgi:hypothetical protein
MPYSPILLVHISAGTLGLLSGTAAMFFRKGSPPSRTGGKGLCGRDAYHGEHCGVPCHRKTSTK